MRQVNRTVGVLFLAASSVYAAQASGQNAAEPGTLADQAKRLFQSPSTQPGSGQGGAGLFGAGSAEPTAGTPADGSELIPIDAGGKKETPLREGQPVKAGQVNVSETGTVEIHVVDANLLEVLRMLAAQSQRNIIASKEVRGAVTANLYDVTIKEALDAILQSNGFAYREKGNFIYVYTSKELEEMERASRRTQTEIFRLFYTPANNAVNMIKPVLSADAQVSFTAPAISGIASGTGDVGGNSHATDDIVVVSDYPENLDKVREVIKEVDRRPQQILVEATILRAALTEDNALGVDFNMLAGVNFNGILGSNGQLTGPSLARPGETVFPTDPISRGVGGFGTGNNFTNSVQNGLRVGFVSDNLSVFIAALEGVTDTTVLANPKILALNKQKGEVVVGREDGYLTTTVTSSSSTQTVEFLQTGTRLIFRPFVGDDGYIRMEIHPEDSSGGLTASSNLPFKITTEVTSNVMVKDGRTIVIGGLFRESSDSSRNQVPLLGNIPLAGNLFRNQRDRTQREEIIILLTPHIIKDDEAYSKESVAAQKDFDKLRVGVRKGMMITGRERLAEISYEKAVTEMNKPTPDRAKALWHLDIATNLNPKFAEAISMKEKLNGAEVSTVDNSSIRGFVRRRVLAESTLPVPMTPPSRRLVEPKDNKTSTDNSTAPASAPASDATVLTPPTAQTSTAHPTTAPSATTATPTPPTPPAPTPSTAVQVTTLEPFGNTTTSTTPTEAATPVEVPTPIATPITPAAPGSDPNPVTPVPSEPATATAPPPPSPKSDEPTAPPTPPHTPPAIGTTAEPTPEATTTGTTVEILPVPTPTATASTPTASNNKGPSLGVLGAVLGRNRRTPTTPTGTPSTRPTETAVATPATRPAITVIEIDSKP